MASVELSDQDWGQLMFVLANAEGKGITWAMVNPLLMKIGGQLQTQQPRSPTAEELKRMGDIRLDGREQTPEEMKRKQDGFVGGKEVRHE
jgi:hypothetical protein